MLKIKRFFNKNISLIVTVIIIVIAFFIGLRLLNYFVRVNNEKKMEERADTTIDSSTYEKSYEIMSGDTKSESTYNSDNNIIKNFIDYCNQKNFEEAYNLLTQNCKDAVFPDVETFKKEYTEKIFTEKRDYSLQAWTSNVYRIKYTKDLLVNGKTTDEDFIEDYISIVGGKLNINTYLGTNTIKRNANKANVTINVERIDYYMDYINVKLRIKNERKTSIMLNDRDNSENIYLQDDGELKYMAFLHELTDEDFIINSGLEREFLMRFDVPYTKSSDIESLNIMNMIADYEQYQELGDSRLIQFNIEL